MATKKPLVTPSHPLPGEPVQTADGSYTLRHTEWEEEFHSHLGARTEAEQLYIEASGFRAALAQAGELTVLDVGLGLAYNALATISAWHEAERAPDLILTSLEIDERLIAALQSGEAPWMTGWPETWCAFARALQKTSDQHWEAVLVRPDGRRCHWTILVGNGLDAKLSGTFAFIWQDPFSPKKNPIMWSQEWFAKIRPHADDGTVLVTYSVARAVRDALEGSGWAWEKIPAGGVKKNWLKAGVAVPSTSEIVSC